MIILNTNLHLETNSHDSHKIAVSLEKKFWEYSEGRCYRYTMKWLQPLNT